MGASPRPLHQSDAHSHSFIKGNFGIGKKNQLPRFSAFPKYPPA
jgi:hypothetical protein